MSYCANIHVAGYGEWRLPTFDELGSVVVNGWLANTPDNRIWGDIQSPSAGFSNFILVTDTVAVRGNMEGVWRNGEPEFSSRQGSFPDKKQFCDKDWVLSSGGKMSQVCSGIGDLWFGTEGDGSKTLGAGIINSYGEFRLICVTPT
jgi:hypothetical protein